MKPRALGTGVSAAVLLLLILLCPIMLPVPALGGAALTDGFVINSSGTVEISGPAVYAVAVQPWNAKLIIGGEFTITSGGLTWTNLARINPDGTLDTAFKPPLLDGTVRAIAIQPDPATPANPELSLVIAGGSFRNCGVEERHGLARFQSADGSLDLDFNPATTGGAVRIKAIAMHPDGKSMLVGGSFAEIVLNKESRNLARIWLAGPAPDPLVWSYSSGLDGEVNAILTQNGSILVGGSFLPPQLPLARLTASGVLEAGFAGNFITAAPGKSLRALALQVDGKLLIGGDFQALQGGAPTTTYLARLNRDGSHDAAFQPGPDSYVASLMVQPDGKLLVAGNFTKLGPLAEPQSRLARLKIDGTLDAPFVAGLDAVVNVICLQRDGKILAGGEFATAGGKPRTRLARFYPHGALDDDVSAAGLSLDGMVSKVSQQPGGAVTIGGVFSQVQGQTRKYLARLTEQWNLAEDAPFDKDLALNSQVTVLEPLNDGGVLVGGYFSSPQKLLLRLDGTGDSDPDGSAEVSGYNVNLAVHMPAVLPFGNVQAMAPLSFDTLAGGTAVAGGSYVGGYFPRLPSPYISLFRVTSSGEKDVSFKPPNTVNWRLYSMAIQPDNKLWIAGAPNVVTGRLQRLKSDGTLDLEVLVDGPVYSVYVQKDEQIVATGGNLRPPIIINGITWQRNILRLKSDGTVDDSFDVAVRADGLAATLYGAVPQTDGSMLIFGVFNHVMDATGTIWDRHSLARIKPDGTLDTAFDVGSFAYSGSAQNNLATVSLQPDGKIILGGSFDAVNGTAAKKLTRFANGWSAEELSVAADGSAITWFRSGTGPELSQVYFECSNDPDAPAWTWLGNAQWQDGVWQLNGLTLGKDYGYNANRYVRARGYTAGEAGSAGSLVQSVRLYYLEQLEQNTEITVKAIDRQKYYGDPDPLLTYTFTPALSNGDSFSGKLSRTGSNNVGSYQIEQGTLALDQKYSIKFDKAIFTIDKAPLLVIAKDQSRAYLTPNPPLTVEYQGLLPGDQLSVISGIPVLTTAASLSSPAGNYAIITSVDALAAKNYRFVPVHGTFSVFKSCQEITFPALPERTFGDPPFEIVASACSGLGLSFTSSNPSVARVNGNVITMTGAGSTVITASQQGSGDQESAPDRSQTFIVHKSGQGVSFYSLAQKVLGDAPFTLDATASSGLPVSYLSSDPGVAVVNGNTVTIVGAGTAVISAVQPGNVNFNPALPAAQPLTVALEGVPPLLALSTLPSGAVTSNPVLNIMGGASDDSGIASLTVNGADRTGEAALFSSAVALAAGVNSISVAARDSAGNQTTQTLSITHDALAPKLTADAPADNSVTDIPSCAVSGSVTPGAAVTLGVNGGSLQLLQVTDGRFSGTGYLMEGVNTVELIAELAGRSSWIKRSVTLAPGAPPLAITEPVQDLRTEQQSLTIRGRTAALLSGSVLLEVDGIVFTPPLSEGVFQQQVNLPGTGEVRITARATDSGGQSSLAQRNVIRIDRISGDLNGNGSVDIEDASQLLRISLGLEPATAAALAHGDLAPVVNGVPQPDGIIDVGDLLVLLRKIVGLVQF